MNHFSFQKCMLYIFLLLSALCINIQPTEAGYIRSKADVTINSDNTVDYIVRCTPTDGNLYKVYGLFLHINFTDKNTGKIILDLPSQGFNFVRPRTVQWSSLEGRTTTIEGHSSLPILKNSTTGQIYNKDNCYISVDFVDINYRQASNW